jgi:NAD-dependent SIR2 family protein deacetylase
LEKDTNLSPHKEVCQNTDCEICRLKRPFALPKEILDAAVKERLVIFAGAGISTEGRKVFPTTLYEEIKRDLEIADSAAISFPNLMSDFCQKRDRKVLMRKIKHRFDYMRWFPEVYRWATRFHKELSTIPYIQDIVTTNWDDLFERECDATPIVTSEDFDAFSDVSGRRVFKIHGSINNVGSIVATEEDYRKCYEDLRTGSIGDNLKVLLASKVVVFIGCSLQDEDFNRTYQILNTEIQNLLPKSFLVTLNENVNATLNSLNMNTTPIVTDATYFIHTLKAALVNDKLMIPDERFEGIKPALTRSEKEHLKLHSLDIHTHPEAIFPIVYQDGLMHAFEHIIGRKNSGKLSNEHYVSHLIHSYEKTQKEFLDAKRYADVAYIEGYRNGLLYFVFDDNQRSNLPMYYLFGCKEKPRDFKQYTKLARNAHKLDESAYAFARKLAEQLHEEGVELHHEPFL